VQTSSVIRACGNADGSRSTRPNGYPGNEPTDEVEKQLPLPWRNPNGSRYFHLAPVISW